MSSTPKDVLLSSGLPDHSSALHTETEKNEMVFDSKTTLQNKNNNNKNTNYCDFKFLAPFNCARAIKTATKAESTTEAEFTLVAGNVEFVVCPALATQPPPTDRPTSERNKEAAKEHAGTTRGDTQVLAKDIDGVAAVKGEKVVTLPAQQKLQQLLHNFQVRQGGKPLTDDDDDDGDNDVRIEAYKGLPLIAQQQKRYLSEITSTHTLIP
ncbi:unnamed protein product [Ceratitis capitata]|uniref:(Mediterranean fruit fly) hypothetical protein n=1 Tax=Ceratitis capitata TaxID=7213 RepID=A0A811VAK6_CERCA|nr:unnamed protein product [Ceratitis capitata]